MRKIDQTLRLSPHVHERIMKEVGKNPDSSFSKLIEAALVAHFKIKAK